MAPFSYLVPRLRGSARAVVGLIRDGCRRRRQRVRLAAGEDPTSRITSPHEALVVAEALLARVRRRHVDDGLWRTVAAGPLAALLYAAGPHGNREGIGWVGRALDDTDSSTAGPGWYRAAEICRAAGAHRQAAMLLERTLVRTALLSSRQQGSICSMMRTAIRPWLALPGRLGAGDS